MLVKVLQENRYVVHVVDQAVFDVESEQHKVKSQEKGRNKEEHDHFRDPKHPSRVFQEPKQSVQVLILLPVAEYVWKSSC